MIVVEGCDGTGKTTLVTQLTGEFGLHVGMRGTRNRDELYKVTREDTYRALALAAEGHRLPYIWDRLGPFSDPIYSRMAKRDCAFKQSELQFCSSLFKAMRVPIIICHVPLYVATENQEKAHQMDGVADNFPFIHGLYENLAMEWRDWVIKYDYRVEGAYQDLKEKVQHYLVNRKDREWRTT